jgi:hypothetical protein
VAIVYSSPAEERGERAAPVGEREGRDGAEREREVTGSGVSGGREDKREEKLIDQ